MSLNEILSIAIFAMLLINGVMFCFVWHYRDKSKQLVRQIAKLQIQISNLREEIEEYADLKELNQKIDEYEESFKHKNSIICRLRANVQSCDEKIEKLKEEHKEALQRKDIAIHKRFKEVQSLNKEIETLKDELKQRDASVKETSHKNKKKSK
ncbi:hypothetical protein [Bartonella raoultii]|uniref:hypothetical protein n=1 Tax=Bartonella raoultii TaxID=1457020 RepID=UPI001ABB0C2F|nr:hypothetical protein [Bartonella raoultii]